MKRAVPVEFRKWLPMNVMTASMFSIKKSPFTCFFFFAMFHFRMALKTLLLESAAVVAHLAAALRGQFEHGGAAQC